MERLVRSLARCVLFWTLLSWGCNTKISRKEHHELKWFNEASLQLQNQNGLFFHDGHAFSGIVYILDQNKKDTVAVCSILNGKEDGEWRKYFSNGQLMERRYFEDGKKTGVYQAWWPNGSKRLVYHFRNGEYQGACTDWNDKGVLINDMNYNEGHENGSQKQFYEDGKIKSNYVISNGRRYGLLGTKNCINVSDSVFN